MSSWWLQKCDNWCGLVPACGSPMPGVWWFSVSGRCCRCHLTYITRQCKFSSGNCQCWINITWSQ